jgi:hypothetical protein
MLLAFVGELGHVMLFLFTLVWTTIVACYAIGYAGVSLLGVVQETAAGNEELTWPDETLPDKAGQALYFAGLLALVLLPVGILVRLLREDLFPGDNGLRFLVLAVPGLWLLFPVGLLSSLAGTSRWFVFHPVLVARLLRLFSATAAFYAVTALLAGLAGLAWYFALFSDFGLYVLPIAAVLGGWLWLLYARLIGRLAHLVGRLGPIGVGPEPEAPKPLERPRKRKKKMSQVRDPWAAPPEGAEAPPKPVIAEGEVVEPYVLGSHEKPVYPDAALLEGRVPESKDDKAERVTRKRRREAPIEPTPAGEGLTTLFAGLATLPLQGKTMGVWIRLTFGFLALGGGVYALLTLYPG